MSAMVMPMRVAAHPVARAPSWSFVFRWPASRLPVRVELLRSQQLVPAAGQNLQTDNRQQQKPAGPHSQ